MGIDWEGIYGDGANLADRWADDAADAMDYNPEDDRVELPEGYYDVDYEAEAARMIDALGSGWKHPVVAVLKPQFPQFTVVLIREGDYFAAYNNDAEVIHRLLGYKIKDTSNGSRCAGKDISAMQGALLRDRYGYVIWEPHKGVTIKAQPDDFPWIHNYE